MGQDKNDTSNQTTDDYPVHSHKLGEELHVARPIKTNAFAKFAQSSKFLPAFVFVLLFGSVGAYYLVSSKANPEIVPTKPQSALERARQATLDIGSIDRALQKSDNTELSNQYAELAQERKQAIKQLLDDGHVQEVWTLMNPEGHGKANGKSQANLEKRTSFSKAILRLDHGHSFKDEPGQETHDETTASDEHSHHDSYDYYYLESNGARKRIHLTKEPDDKFLNKKVAAKDVVELGDEIVADTQQLQLETAQEPVVAAAAVNKKVAAVMVKFTSTTTDPFTKETVKSAVFNTTGQSANTYFKETSFGQVNLVGVTDPSGDVFDWTTIDSDPSTCAYATWSAAAEAALRAKGVDLTPYTNIIFFFPSVGSCPWAGVGMVGSPSTTSVLKTWIRGTSVRVISHELGHNFGALHAGTYKCTENGVPVTYSSVTANCSSVEYGDPFDVMGTSTKQMSNYYKLRNGYIPTTNIQTITASGTYQLKNPESLTTGTQVIRIPAVVDSKGVTTQWYHLEYRQPSGIFDTFLATDPAVNGISVRLGKDYANAYHTQLLDMTPSTTSSLDSALAFGKTFTDTSRNLQITAVSAASGIASVKITSNTPTCIQNTPTFGVTPTTQWADPGKPLTYSIAITNNDTANCPAQTFNISGTLPTGLTQTLSSSSVSLAPGASTTVTATVTSSGTIAAGYYGFSEQIVRSGSTVVLGKVTANYNVNQVINQPPIVTITTPAAGSVINAKKATVSAYATSPSTATVSSIKAYIDGALVSTGTSSINYNWNFAKVKSGSHTITVTATNSAGQSTTKTITISKP